MASTPAAMAACIAALTVTLCTTAMAGQEKCAQMSAGLTSSWAVTAKKWLMAGAAAPVIAPPALPQKLKPWVPPSPGVAPWHASNLAPQPAAIFHAQAKSMLGHCWLGPSPMMVGGACDTKIPQFKPGQRYIKDGNAWKPDTGQVSATATYGISKRGFAEVVRLTKLNADGTHQHVCTGVLIQVNPLDKHVGKVLTARHCVLGDKDNRSGLMTTNLTNCEATENTPSNPIKCPLRLAIQSAPNASVAQTPCGSGFEMGGLACAANFGTVQQVWAFATKPEPILSMAIPAPDVVVIEARFAAPLDPATVAQLPPVPQKIKAPAPITLTVTGFGPADTQPGFNAGYWNTAQLVPTQPGSSPNLVAVQHPIGTPRICVGDSGAPVFADSHNGHPGERPRTVWGLVAATASASNCANSVASAVQVLHPDVVTNIREVLTNGH